VKALQIIDAVRAVGVTLSIDGESLLLRSGSPPPQDILDALTRHKSEVMDFVRSDRSGWFAQEWQAFFEERAVIAEFNGGSTRQDAEALARGLCRRMAQSQPDPHSAGPLLLVRGWRARRQRAPSVWNRACRSCLDAQPLLAVVA
jgi:hypothetical protein